jgi:ribonuclease Z
MNLLGRIHELHIHGPKALEEILKLQLKVSDTVLTFKLTFHPLKQEEHIVDDKRLTVSCFRVKHRIECWGFIFREKKNPRKLNADKAAALEIPAVYYEKLQQGHDYTRKDGTVIKNEDVTTAASKGKKYAYCADTIYDEDLVDIVKHADLLYHETTYLKDAADRAASRYHSTTVQAAAIAALSNAKKLLIGHFSSKYETLDEFLIEAKEVFENTELALEGTCYRI